MNDDRARRFWEEFCDACPEVDRTMPYRTWYFCDNRDCADRLYQLVLDGKKRATARYADANDPHPPAVGQMNVVTSFDGDPKCVIRITEVRELPFDKVDAGFAYDEGEGDRTIEYWRDAHWKFFSRYCESVGLTPAPNMAVVCQRFEMLYPLEKT